MKQPLLYKTFLTLSICITLGSSNSIGAQTANEATPLQAQIFQMRVLGEPVIPVAEANSNEENEVYDLLQRFGANPTVQVLDQITSWTESHKQSAYTPSLLLNTGAIYFNRGYYRRAINAWKQGWELGRDFTGETARTIADANYGNLSKMYARLGRMEELEALLKETQGRQLLGPGDTLASNSKVGLDGMRESPGTTFKCGPFALSSIREELGIADYYHPLIQDEQSTTRGTSLAQLAKLAVNLEMSFVPVHRIGNSEYPMPSIIHWKLGHYAALLRKEGDQYLIKDPTFGQETYVSRDALDSESSGYFLTDISKAQPGSIRAISEETALTVWGKGFPEDTDPDEDDPCKPEGGGSAAQCKTCPCDLPPQCESGDCPTGDPMASYSFKLSMASLSVKDTPISYQPPVGKQVHFTVTYSQRGTNHPTTYDYGNLGPNWYYNWFSTVDDNPAQLNNVIRIKTRGGGRTGYTYDVVSAGHTKHNRSLATLERISTAPIVYRRTYSNGAKDIYSHVLSSSGDSRRIALTESYDEVGNKTTLHYDACHRLVAIEDAAGQLTTIQYNTPSGGSCATQSNYLIRSVTDPYGRQAVFNYTPGGQLESITDVIGIVSSFTYNGNFLNSMTTPYGTTTFAKESGEPGAYRWVEATDPFGEKERVEFFRDSSIFTNLRASNVPVGFTSSWFNYRNVAFWSKKAMREAYGDYEAAHVYHFLHSQQLQYMSGTLENEKPPYQDRIYYKYPNQTQGNIEGSSKQPIEIARKVDGGATQKVVMEYNSKGNVTKQTDPAGRITHYTYEPNGIDMIAAYQQTGLTSITLVEVQYTNHLPTVITDAAGQETAVTYNALGQPETVTNAFGQTSTYDYSTTGLLKRVISPDPYKYAAFNYDAFDRISSATLFPEGYTIRLAYDAADRVTTVTYPDGTTEESVYDRLDLSKSKDRLDQWSQYLYGNMPGRPYAVVNPAGEMVQFDWCRCGALSRLVDAEGRITLFDYDVAGRLLRKELPDGSTQTYEYENMTGRTKSVTDNKRQKTSVSYNVDNTIASVSVSNVAPGTKSVAPLSFTYETYFKRLASRTDGIGTTNFSYHPINPADSAYGDGSLASVDGPWGNDTITYSYDELGRATQRQINGAANTVSAVYDSVGRLESITNPLSTFTYDYKPHTSMVTGVSSPDGGSTLFGYKDVHEDFDLDFIENIDPLSNPLSKFSYAQDVLGRITEWVQQEGSGTSQTFTAEYDKSSRLTQWTKSDDTNGRTSQWNWRFDRAGNRLSQQLAKILDGTVAREKYNVNEADQVKKVLSGGPLHVSGQLDKQGKINTGVTSAPVLTSPDGSFSAWANTEFTTGAHVLASDFSNNTTSTWVSVTPEPLPTHEFEYDGNGNTTKVITTSADGLSSSVTTYEWDAWDQLVAVVKGSNRSEFTYDGMGRRVRILELDGFTTSSDTYYLWEGLSIAEERNAPGAAPVKLFYAGLGECHTDGALANYYYATDHSGSVRQVTNESGAVVGVYSYDAYGNPTIASETGGLTGTFLYTGHFYHRPSGLYLAPYRAYDPAIGKWLSREPLGLDGPNLYHYVFNNPIAFIDPTGLQMYHAPGTPVISGGYPGENEERGGPPPIEWPYIPGGWNSLENARYDFLKPDAVFVCERQADVPGGTFLWNFFGIGHRWVHTQYGSWGLGPGDGNNIPNANSMQIFLPTAITNHNGEIFKPGTRIKYIPGASAQKIYSTTEYGLTGKIWGFEGNCHGAANQIIDKGGK